MYKRFAGSNDGVVNAKRPVSYAGLGDFERERKSENGDYKFLMNGLTSSEKQQRSSNKNSDSHSANDFIRCGSVRGVRNGVRRTIGQLLLQCQWTKNYEEEDRGKVVVYMTSLGVVRRTWERCRSAVAILEDHLVDFERRDLGLSRQLKDEFQNRVGNDPHLGDLPAVFVDGRYFGGVDVLEKWSECGLLKHFLEPYKRASNRRSLCQKCYGFRYYPCTTCRGSKKSPTVISPQIDIPRLKCTRCDYGGLVACNECKDGYTD